MSHVVQPQQANGNAQTNNQQKGNEIVQGDNSASHNDSMLHIPNIFMTKTASMAFLELPGANGRKFYFGENTMKQILLPDHSTQNQNTSSHASNPIPIKFPILQL